MLRTVISSVWVSAGVFILPALLALAMVRPRAHLAEVDDRTRGTRVAAAATAVALLSLGVSALLGTGPVAAGVAAAVLGGAVLVAAWRLHAWAVRGVVAWSLLVAGVGAFLAWLLDRLLDSALPPWQAVVSGAAWVLLVVAALRLRAPAQAVVGARALVRTRGAVTPLPSLRRQLWPLAAMLTAGAVAVVATSPGVEPAGHAQDGAQVRADDGARSSLPTASTTTGTTPERSVSLTPKTGTDGPATAPGSPRHRAPGHAPEARPPQQAGTQPREPMAGPDQPADRAVVERIWGSRTRPAENGRRSSTRRRTTARGPRDHRSFVRTEHSSTQRHTHKSARASARGDREGRGPDAGATTRAGNRPTARATSRPTAHMTSRPSAHPTSRPSASPTRRPVVRPTSRATVRRRPGSRPPTRRSSPSVSPRPSATADTWDELLRPRRRPEDRPTKVWGVMPPDALPEQGRWQDPGIGRRG